MLTIFKTNTMNTEELAKLLKDNYNFNHSEEEIVEAFKLIRDAFQHPLFHLKIVSELISKFESDTEDVDKYFGNKRNKYIIGKINLIRDYINLDRYNIRPNGFYNEKFNYQLLTNKIAEIRNELKDCLKYWEDELLQTPNHSDKIKRLDIEYKIEQAIWSFEKAFMQACFTKDKDLKLDQHKEELIFSKIILSKYLDKLTEDQKIKTTDSILYSLSNIKPKLYKKSDIEFVLKTMSEYQAYTQKKIENEPKFSDFFINVKDSKIDIIHENFKNLTGKDIAIFISLTYHHFEILYVVQNSKHGQSLKSLISLFKKNKSYQSVYNYLDPNIIYNGHTDDLSKIKKQLNQILSEVDS